VSYASKACCVIDPRSATCDGKGFGTDGQAERVVLDYFAPGKGLDTFENAPQSRLCTPWAAAVGRRTRLQVVIQYPTGCLHEDREMYMKSNRMVTMTVLGCFFLFYATIAAALPFTLTINQPDRIGFPGDTEIFAGTITNNTGADVIASNLFLDISGYDPTVVSLVQLLGSPDFSIANGDTSAMVDLFSLTLNLLAVPGTAYFADIFVQDGNNPANFSNIVTVSKFVPEPATLALIGIGLLAILGTGRARSRQV
jgi:hypothetical protein